MRINPNKPAAAHATSAAKGAAPVAKPATARPTSTVKLVAAALDEGPSAPSLVAPRGFTLATGEDTRKVSVALPNGKSVDLDWSYQTLTAKDAAGKTVTLAGKDEQAFTQLKADFESTYKNLKAGDPDLEYATGWDSSRGYSGVGAAGQLVSVAEDVSDFTGGAHPNSGTALQTFDLRTGKPVTLDQLLSKEQLHDLARQIQARLPGLSNEDNVEGSTFEPFSEAGKPALADYLKLANENFALTTDKAGKVQIHIAWQSGIHALGPTSAHFTFAAPTDAAFAQKIGLK